ncbi:MAG TPA: biotin carboxylase N-terminal domain-containing protein [Alphaproteobacteria bacterium]|nr:biotin carboxylase N-terminal domain-containing protein [Alphaproteobacteria bacterium]
MLKKVLIANRGEIACRVIRTLRRLGIGSVAVYHHEDRLAPHVKLADEAVRLEGDVPTAAYLDQDQVIAICKSTGADGIHPGYGFLSENAGFAEKVATAGIIFIGPEAEVMRLMGDKIRSRIFAAENGVPVAPSAMQEGDLESFLKKAAAVGFPLLIKASAGGGGKGMKIVRTAGELAENIRVAASEAQRYFGDGRIYAERLVELPRHIEVQVLGDGKGNVVHLFERECSIQRRYQKIVEESPAPNLPGKLRDEICAAAVRLASAAKYKNAGTIEFILGADGAFYFLEMNTRLQVEHPVTEMVVGIDLVEAQLRIASGEGLPVSQKDLKQTGHAIECRINAEEPEKDFRPATGKVGILRVPEGEGVRFDAGIVQGQAVTPAFDSMLAKLIAYGPTRAEAAKRMERALQELALLGVPTNIDYLARIMRNKEFLAGKLHTGFLAQEAADLAAPPLASEEETAAILAAAFSDPDFRRIAFEIPEPYASIGYWRN